MAMVKKVPKTLLLSLVYLLCPLPVTSLSFSFNFSTPGALSSPDLKYMSNATAAGDRVSLTKNTTWSTGRVAYGRPVQLWDDTGKVASFTSNFSFVILKSRNSSAAQGDGMAFFVGTYPPEVPQDSGGGLLGLVSSPFNPANTYFPSTVAVEFDAFRNEWDPKNTVSHVGVDVSNISSVAYAALPDGCFDGAMSAWVRYDANASRLSVTLRFDDRPGLGVYNVSARVDLRAEELPQQAAVGFSAATGESVESHQILSWSFESTLINKTTEKRRTSKTRNIGLIAGLASAAGIVVLLLVLAAWLCYGYRESQKRNMDDELRKGTATAGPRRFTYRQLSRATRRFSDDAKLGEGGFGAVYRGFLQDEDQGLHLHVAIKRISKASKQGRREYVSEVTIISRLRHRNLVQLVGWCHEADELLLVYELMTNGSLDTHLYSARNVLTWPVRYNIILGLASALLYLHQEWEQCVVHRDIKPSNVMLDSEFNAKLGDFGLARLVSHARDAHTTMVAGTRGYIDPECAVTCRATTRSDVYSFGVLLLEIACGRKPVVPEEEDDTKVLLVRWVWDLYGRGQLLDAADKRLLPLHGVRLELEVERTLVAGLWCVHPDSASRPSIRQAMNVLQFEAPLPELPPEMPVATYGPPPTVPAAAGGGYYQQSSSDTTSTSGTGSRASSSRGHSAAAIDQTAHRVVGDEQHPARSTFSRRSHLSQ